MLQQKTRIANQLKAFACAWYARFDRGTSVPELLPFLPDEQVEFAYPDTTLATVEELRQYMEAGSSKSEITKSFTSTKAPLPVWRLNLGNGKTVTLARGCTATLPDWSATAGTCRGTEQ